MREECLTTHLADKEVAIKTAVDDVKQQMTATMAEKMRDLERQVRDQCAEDYEHTLQEGECSTQRFNDLLFLLKISASDIDSNCVLLGCDVTTVPLAQRASSGRRRSAWASSATCRSGWRRRARRGEAASFRRRSTRRGSPGSSRCSETSPRSVPVRAHLLKHLCTRACVAVLVGFDTYGTSVLVPSCYAFR